MLKKFLNFDIWTKLVVFYLWSSLIIGKVSAYLGLLLGGLLIFSVRVLWNRWYHALTSREDPMRQSGLGPPGFLALRYCRGNLRGFLFRSFSFHRAADSGLQPWSRLPVSRDLGWETPPRGDPNIHQGPVVVDGDLHPYLFSLFAAPELDVYRDTARDGLRRAGKSWLRNVASAGPAYPGAGDLLDFGFPS